MSTAKSERINLRASEYQESMLRRAAEVETTSMSDFILASAVDRAERVLADRRWFAASPEEFEEFVQLLDAPIPTTKLAALFARPDVFERPFELDD